MNKSQAYESGKLDARHNQKKGFDRVFIYKGNHEKFNQFYTAYQQGFTEETRRIQLEFKSTVPLPVALFPFSLAIVGCFILTNRM